MTWHVSSCSIVTHDGKEDKKKRRRDPRTRSWVATSWGVYVSSVTQGVEDSVLVGPGECRETIGETRCVVSVGHRPRRARERLAPRYILDLE